MDVSSLGGFPKMPFVFMTRRQGAQWACAQAGFAGTSGSCWPLTSVLNQGNTELCTGPTLEYLLSRVLAGHSPKPGPKETPQTPEPGFQQAAHYQCQCWELKTQALAQPGLCPASPATSPTELLPTACLCEVWILLSGGAFHTSMLDWT